MKKNKQKNKQKTKLAFQPKTKTILTGVILLILASIQIVTLFSFNQQTYADNVNNSAANGLILGVNNESLISQPDATQIAAAMVQKPIQEEQERKAQERQNHIDGLVKFLKGQGSPIASADYAAQIIDLATANGADYRVVVAIMGVESGFCRAPIGTTHNCFGYLNHVKYGSFTAALNDLVPKVSRQYAARFGWNFTSLAKAYGQIEWEKTSADMYHYASSL